jgi:hypothetical protein
MVRDTGGRFQRRTCFRATDETVAECRRAPTQFEDAELGARPRRSVMLSPCGQGQGLSVAFDQLPISPNRPAITIIDKEIS